MGVHKDAERTQVIRIEVFKCLLHMTKGGKFMECSAI